MKDSKQESTFASEKDINKAHFTNIFETKVIFPLNGDIQNKKKKEWDDNTIKGALDLISQNRYLLYNDLLGIKSFLENEPERNNNYFILPSVECSFS